MKTMFAIAITKIIAILCLATFFFSGCQMVPPLKGREFSTLVVTGDGGQLSDQIVRSGLTQAGAKLDVVGEASLAVNARIGEYNGVPLTILSAETSTGIRAWGFSRLSDSGGIRAEHLLRSATGDLTKTLGRKVPCK